MLLNFVATYAAAILMAMPATVEARLRDVRFYVLPRMSPDGAEAVMATGRYVRSIPRDERPAPVRVPRRVLLGARARAAHGGLARRHGTRRILA